ncbi:MAG: endonuclease/exonuclease/phosphatase family protein [Thermoanaerobaculia bacterium]
MDIRVLTYNIHRAIGLDRRFRPERIVQVLEHYQADVVLLQEVDEGAPRSRELDLARELAEAAGYPHRAVGHNVTLRKGRYGNATLSRFPILRERNIDLTVGSKKRRGCQHATIELPGGAAAGSLEVFNLHLGLSAREREQQVGILVHSDEFARLARDRACLLGGDFNDWRTRLRVAFCEVLDFACITDRGTASSPRSLHTYPSPSPRGGLDKLFLRGPLRAVKVQTCRLGVSRVASDHLPVIADLAVR